MELKELAGLHILRRLEIVDGLANSRIAHFTLDNLSYTVSEFRLENGASRMRGPDVSGVVSPADGPGIPAFCLHRDTSFSGHSCEDADILEIYNAITAKKLLTIGTKNISRNCRCIIEGNPIRIVGFPGRASTAWGGFVEIPAGDDCLFRFGDDQCGDADTPEFARKNLGRWQCGIDLAEGRDFTPTEE